MSIAQQIREELAQANGWRRIRIVTEREAAEVILEAIASGKDYTTGGSVANSYGYRAVSTVFVATCEGGTVAFKAGTANAQNPTPAACGCFAWDKRKTEENREAARLAFHNATDARVKASHQIPAKLARIWALSVIDPSPENHAVLSDWCAERGIDPAEVFGACTVFSQSVEG